MTDATPELPHPPAPLGRRERRIWTADPGAYGGRRARRGGPYDVFLPVEIADRNFSFSQDTVAAIAEATQELARLNGIPSRVTSLEALARNVVRSEAAASSRIEGLDISHRRLARAFYAGENTEGGDRRAAEVVGNAEALTRAVSLGEVAQPITVDDVCDIHRTLLRHTFDERIAGIVRNKQNWIGGNDFNPLDAAYVPPPPEVVHGLLADMCAFIERDDLAPVAQAAIAHAQFETIHPFADGNGRVGRSLIHTVLRRGGEAPQFIPPISLVLARRKDEYIASLEAYREGDVDGWCAQFADAVTRASAHAERLADDLEELQSTWLAQLDHPRADAAVRQILRVLPVHPVLDIRAGQRITGKSHVAVGRAVSLLEHADILSPLHERKWGRVWECQPLLNLVAEFEHFL